MPPIFKALATISVWVLFIGGLITAASDLVMTAAAGQLYSVNSPPPIEFYVALGVATISLALSVVCMKLRQMLE